MSNIRFSFHCRKLEMFVLYLLSLFWSCIWCFKLYSFCIFLLSPFLLQQQQRWEWEESVSAISVAVVVVVPHSCFTSFVVFFFSQKLFLFLLPLTLSQNCQEGLSRKSRDEKLLTYDECSSLSVGTIYRQSVSFQSPQRVRLFSIVLFQL